MTKIDPASIKRFANALSMALKDVHKERSKPLVFFFDADVILGAIQGLTLTEETPPNATDPKLIIRALLVTQQLGQIRMLRPHLLEFERNISSWPSPHRVMSDAFRRAQTSYLAEFWGLRDYDRILKDMVFEKEQRLQRRQFKKFIANVGYEVFIKLELCYGGSWLQRLQRAYNDKLFDFTPWHTEDRFSPDDPTAARFVALLSRHPGREETNINNVIDGIALSTISRLIASGIGTEIRFYSETLAMREIFDHEPGRSLLAYQEHGSYETILRSADYFLMRCSFPCLRLNSGLNQEEPIDELSLKDLQDISEQLTKLLEVHNRDSLLHENALRAIRVRSRPLHEIIQDFVELRFLSSVVLTRNFSKDLFELLPNLAEAFGNDELKRSVREDLDKTFQSVSENLREQVTYLRAWKMRFQRIYAGILERRKDLCGHVPKLETDIGLGRWGIQSRLQSIGDIERIIAQITEAPPENLLIIASDLAVKIGQATELRKADFEIALILLWFLQITDLLCLIWKKRKDRADLDFSLEVLYLVSKVKLQRQERDRRSAWSRLVSAVHSAEQLIKKAPLTEEPFALMGAAHVCYWASKIAVESWLGGPEARSRDPLIQEFGGQATTWMEKSFDYAWKAFGLLPRETIEWAFAANHCAYVGHRANIRDRETLLCYEELNRSARLHRHYRFADTLALPYTLSARRLILQEGPESLRRDPLLLNKRNSACNSLHQAKDFLENAKPFFGDEEIIAHMNEVHYLYGQLDCDRLEDF